MKGPSSRNEARPKSRRGHAPRLFDLGLIIYPSLGLSFLIWKCGSEYFHALAVLWIITSIIYVRIKV